MQKASKEYQAMSDDECKKRIMNLINKMDSKQLRYYYILLNEINLNSSKKEEL